MSKAVHPLMSESRINEALTNAWHQYGNLIYQFFNKKDLVFFMQGKIVVSRLERKDTCDKLNSLIKHFDK